MVPLNSAPDAVTYTRFQPSEAALKILDDLKIPRDVTRDECRFFLVERMRMMNPSQARELLTKMGEVLREIQE